MTVAKPLRPFFSFFGGKWTLAPRYPSPTHGILVEPFAGSAGYATRYSDREVILVEREPVVASLWRWLIGVSVDEVRGSRSIHQSGTRSGLKRPRSSGSGALEVALAPR